MTISRRRGADLSDLLLELRRMQAESRRSEEELWGAIDEIRSLLLAQAAATGSGSAPVPLPDERQAKAAEYRKLKRRLRGLVASAVPGGGEVAVVSKGDDELLRLPGLKARHFPCAPGGGFAGFYLPDGTSAIAHLEWVRASGASCLVFPHTSLWWLDSFPRLRAHLERTATLVAQEEGVGAVYELRGEPAEEPDPIERVAELLAGWEDHQGQPPSVLDWDSGRGLAARFEGHPVFSPAHARGTLPYLDESVDVVVLSGEEPGRIDEARRVATRSMVRFRDTAAGNGSAPDEVIIQHRKAPPPPLPGASIVIPTYNGIDHVSICVRALATSLPRHFAGEVLVVDDGSGPETVRGLRELERRHDWLRVVRNRRNRGFIDSCNRGAAEATGEYVVFLNDDTVPLAGWLPALLRTFRGHPDAGAVGGRLVYPDGRLQEAGGVVYRDGTGANFGRGDFQLDAPLYSFVRAVDYCSGALLATPRELFLSLGGFDTTYRPAYYEDTDYCFSVRASGRRVYYQPEAVVVHTEGASSGTDIGTGVKRFQARNRETFLAKWAGELGSHPAPPNHYTPSTWHRLAFTAGDP